MKFLRIIVLLALTIAILLSATPVFAIDPPDSTPTAEFFVYRNLLETGDWLLLIYQNIPYATPPTDPIWQTFMWRFTDTDNVSEFGTALSYSFNDYGYGYNLTSMYFSADNVTGQGLTWGTGYTVRLSGNPVAFESPPEYNFTISSGDYSVLTLSADVQAELASRIFLIASDLDIRWGLGATYSLLNEIETGTVLSIYGEAFFRGAIYGLQGLAPAVFAYVISDIDFTPRTWDTTHVTQLQDQYQGTWVQTSREAWTVLFGTSYDLTTIILSLLACFVVLIIGIIMGNDAWLAVLDTFVMAIVLARLGFYDLGFLGIIEGVCVIYISARLWGVFRG